MANSIFTPKTSTVQPTPGPKPATQQNTPNTMQSALEAQIAALRAENEALRTRRAQEAASRMSLKVSQKGAVSLYGMGRFPVTLYPEQWMKLVEFAPKIEEFVAAGLANGTLTTKAQRTTAE